jgi:hypothetical protein
MDGWMDGWRMMMTLMLMMMMMMMMMMSSSGLSSSHDRHGEHRTESAERMPNNSLPLDMKKQAEMGRKEAFHPIEPLNTRTGFPERVRV